MKVIIMGCIHEQHEQLNPWMIDNIDDTDYIIVTGDVANSSVASINYNPMMNFLEWLNGWNVPSIFVPGNHDTSYQANMVDSIDMENLNNITPLIHESVTINVGDESYNVFGSPYTPAFGEGWAYNVKRNKLDKYWAEIPDNTDIIITHGPPKGVRDLTDDSYGSGGKIQVGCKSLLNHVHRVKPIIHCFSHLHDEKDIYNHGISEMWGTKFINCSIVDLRHSVINNPIKIEI